jgi:predicted amidophosphoribosyltransferase
MKHPALEGGEICGRCWPEYAEANGLCESCGSELEAIYENNGFTEPEGPSKWEISGYKPCVECNQPDDEE